ncbi:unnamed protein product, partial [Brassica oleracea]
WIQFELGYCRALPRREPFQKFSKAQDNPRRGFGNSFQPAIDVPRSLTLRPRKDHGLPLAVSLPLAQRFFSKEHA